MPSTLQDLALYGHPEGFCRAFSFAAGQLALEVSCAMRRAGWASPVRASQKTGEICLVFSVTFTTAGTMGTIGSRPKTGSGVAARPGQGMPLRVTACADCVLQVWEGRWRVIPYDVLPDWLKDNDYLLHGHRPPMPSFRACFKSIFRIHTETGNIWTHLLGDLAGSTKSWADAYFCGTSDRCLTRQGPCLKGLIGRP